MTGCGTGKSHFVEALAQKTIEADLRMAWFTLATLTATIGRAKAEGSTARTMTLVVGGLYKGWSAATEAARLRIGDARRLSRREADWPLPILTEAGDRSA